MSGLNAGIGRIERECAGGSGADEQCGSSPAGLTLVGGAKGPAKPAEPAAWEILAEAVDYTGRLLSSLRQTVGLYRTGDARNAGNAFVDLVQGLELFTQILAVVETHLQVDFAATTFRGESLADAVSRLNGVFAEMVQAQERCDLVFLADILEYELAPSLEQWRELFGALDSGETSTGRSADR
jgi:hypothetical protein